MIHLAIGLFVVSLTCLVLSLLSIVDSNVPHASRAFEMGSALCVGFSATIVVAVVRRRL